MNERFMLQQGTMIYKFMSWKIELVKISS